MGTFAHSQPHATVTTKLFCFSSDVENRTVVLSRPPALGAGGPRFKSGRPDQNYLPYFLQLIKSVLHPKLLCGILAGRSSQFASRLISESSLHDEFAKTRRGRSAIQKLLNGGKLSARYLASMGKIQGTPCISLLINLRKCKSSLEPEHRLAEVIGQMVRAAQ